MRTNPTETKAGRLLMWSCLWGGGIAWLVHLLGIWIFAEFGCIGGLGTAGPLGISLVAWLVLALSAVCLFLAGLAFLASWRWCPRTDGVASFCAHCGMAASLLFMLVIVAQTIPVFFHLKECGSAIG